MTGNGASADGCAIVTGASRGFGRAIAAELAARGLPVVLAARGREDLARAAAEIEADGGQALAVAADVSDEADADSIVVRAIETYGRIDVLVNNAGAPPVLKELDRLEWDEWMRGIDVDVRGVFNTTRRVAPLMRAEGRGTIVNVSSGAVIADTPLHVSFSPAQAAVLSLSRCIDGWLRGDGIAVHTLCPTITPEGGVGRVAGEAFGATAGISGAEWFERRFGENVIDAADVGRAVAELTSRPRGSVWWVGPGGLEEWAGVLSPPVAI